MNNFETNTGFNPEAVAEYDTNTEEYQAFVGDVLQKLVPNRRELFYVPSEDNHLGGLEHTDKLDTLSPEELDTQLAPGPNAIDTIISLSRSHEIDPGFDPSVNNHNIVLSPSSIANTDVSVDVFKRAKELGNDHVELIMSGWSHAGFAGPFIKLPYMGEGMQRIFEATSTDEGEAVSEAEFAATLEASISHMTDDEKVKFARSVLGAGAGVEDVEQAQMILYADFHNLPQISEAALMKERALAAGVPEEDMFVEGDSIETITQFLYTLKRLQETGSKHVAVVVGKDQMPRALWLADHILPDNIAVTLIESHTALAENEYDYWLEKEHKSFKAGSNWIGGSRHAGDIAKKVYEGYLKNPKTHNEISKIVHSQETR